MSIESTTNLPLAEISMYGACDIDQDEDKRAVSALTLEFQNNKHLELRHKAAIIKVLEEQELSSDNLQDFYQGIVQLDKTKSATSTSTSISLSSDPLPGRLSFTEMKAQEDELLEEIMKQKLLSEVMGLLNAYITINGEEVAPVKDKNQIVNTVLKLRLSEEATLTIIDKVFSFEDSETINLMARDVLASSSSPHPVDYMFAQKRSADFIKLYLERLDKLRVRNIDDQLMFTIMGAEHLTIDEKYELAKKVIGSTYLDGLTLVALERETGNRVLHRSVVLANQQITGMLIEKQEIKALFSRINTQGKTAHQIWREHQIELQKKFGTAV